MAEDAKDPKEAEPYTPPAVSVQPSATGVAATSEEAADDDVGTVEPGRE
jgi:hypothetical protein